jgi:predicted helicase
MYRPYCKQWLYFDRQLNERVLLMPRLFPTPQHPNVVIATTGVGASRPFSALITDVIPNLHLEDTGQCFPLYHYEPDTGDGATLFSDGEVLDGYRRRDAISDQTLARYQGRYGTDLAKDDIFYYVYGLLHAPDYKQRYAADLKKMIARIPMVEDFWAYSHAGRELASWHLGYESADPYSLDEIATSDHAGERAGWRVEKMRFAKTGSAKDKTRIVYNTHVTLAGIPDEAYRYEVNGKSAIEWLIDRYEVKTDPNSGIVNDPNTWAAEHDQPRYIIDLVKRVVTVSIETTNIVAKLPTVELAATPV